MIYWRKVRPGEPIRADDINNLALAALGGFSISDDFTVSETPDGQILRLKKSIKNLFPNTVCQAKNSTGSALEYGSCARISGQTFDEPRYNDQFVLELSAFSASADNTKIAIANEPIEDGAMGEIVIAGIALALVTGSTGDYAEPASGLDTLSVGDSGPAQVLWLNASDGIAMVRFPVGSAGASLPSHSHSGPSDGGYIATFTGSY